MIKKFIIAIISLFLISISYININYNFLFEKEVKNYRIQNIDENFIDDEMLKDFQSFKFIFFDIETLITKSNPKVVYINEGYDYQYRVYFSEKYYKICVQKFNSCSIKINI